MLVKIFWWLPSKYFIISSNDYDPLFLVYSCSSKQACSFTRGSMSISGLIGNVRDGNTTAPENTQINSIQPNYG